MGSRRPKKLKTTSPREASHDAITTGTASAIDGETHDRIVKNLKRELDECQTKAKFDEELAERTKTDALKMASDYKSRLDALKADCKAISDERDMWKVQHQELFERHERVVAKLNKEHGVLVKSLRRDLEKERGSVAMLKDLLAEGWRHEADSEQQGGGQAGRGAAGASSAQGTVVQCAGEKSGKEEEATDLPGEGVREA